jgi:hypothetical protein
MVIKKIKALAVAKAHVAKLEREISTELHHELAGLPAKFGFSTIGAFLGAVKVATREKRGRRSGRPAKATPVVKRRKRGKITDDIRAKVKQLVQAGKTGSQIAKAVKISLPSVQNVKKALGLVKISKKSAPKPKIHRQAKRSAGPKPRKKRVSPKKESPAETIQSQTSAETSAPST